MCECQSDDNDDDDDGDGGGGADAADDGDDDGDDERKYCACELSSLFRLSVLVPARFDCIFGPAYKGITLAAAQLGS